MNTPPTDDPRRPTATSSDREPEYQTGKGCLVLGGLVLAATIVSVFIMYLFAQPG